MLSLGCSGTVETTVLSGFLAVADLTRPYRVVEFQASICGRRKRFAQQHQFQ